MNPLIIIAGPTACGKTSVSIELAKKINSEIISADSMQVYKYMDIGTAKATSEEMQGIKHYMIDELYPDDDFSVAVFQNMAKKAYGEILSKNKIPIMVGGTGFYINAFLYDNDFTAEKKNYEIREQLTNLANTEGIDALFDILCEIDIEYANTVHKNNVKKVIRAIEYYKETGEKFSVYNARERLRKPVYNCDMFILNMNRETLYARIDTRIDIMLKNGLVDEVKFLLSKYPKELVSMQGLGYKEIVGYLEGKYSLEEAVYILKRDTRHFAKRQITWFKHQSSGIWIDMDNFNDINGVVDFIIEKSKTINMN